MNKSFTLSIFSNRKYVGGDFLRKKIKEPNIKLVVTLCVIYGFLISLVILFLISAASIKIGFTEDFIAPLSLTAMLIGNYMSGVCCGYKIRKNGFLCGAYCGIAAALVCFLGSCIFGTILHIKLFKIFGMIFASSLGGVVGVNIKKTEY